MALSLASTGVYAGSVKDMMEKNFKSMINTTTPKQYQGARRGVFSGGSIYARNEIKTVKLASMQAPSISAGCGGISIYGGAFSFINADQMVETFQAIGSNAIGYGLKLAIQNACDTCENVMTSLEKTAQFINKMNIDSCTAAQGIVDAGADLASQSMADVKAKAENAWNGVANDFSQAWAWNEEKGTTPASQMKKDDPAAAAEKLTGNVVWRAIVDGKVKNAFGADDDKFLEMLMSIMGTSIMDFSNAEDVQTISHSGHKITLQNLMDGGEFKIFKCTDSKDKNGCLQVETEGQTIDLLSYSDTIRNAYVDTSDGMIAAMVNDKEWSDLAKTVLNAPSLLSTTCNDAIRRVIMKDKNDVTKASQIALNCSTRISLDMAYAYVSSLFLSVEPLLQNAEMVSKNEAAKQKAIDALKAAKKEYDLEYQTLIMSLPIEGILMLLQSEKESGNPISNLKP